MLALAAAARALRPVPSRANPVPAAAPWKDGSALAKSGGKAVAAAGLALSFWPAASFAAEDLEIGGPRGHASLPVVDQQKRQRQKGQRPRRRARRRFEPAGLRPRGAEGDRARDRRRRLALDGYDSLTGEIRESASERIGSEAPVVETNAPQQQRSHACRGKRAGGRQVAARVGGEVRGSRSKISRDEAARRARARGRWTMLEGRPRPRPRSPRGALRSSARQRAPQHPTVSTAPALRISGAGLFGHRCREARAAPARHARVGVRGGHALADGSG